jgi:methylmalonyl-CoA/ethylmalonyl-CoA epimerase
MEESKEKQSAFSHLIHIGVVVKDMDKAVERLTLLGIGPFKFFTLPDAAETFRGKPFIPAQRVAIKMAQMGNMVLELLQPLEGESPHREFLEEKGEGVQHLGFIVNDLAKEVGDLTQKGSSILLGSQHKGGGGVAYLDLEVGGLIVELVQPAR